MTTWDDVMVPNYGTPGLQLASGTGVTLTDSNGKTYTDFLSGIAVNALGQAHPDVVAAITKQVLTLGHTSNLYAHAPGVELARRLRKLAGDRHKILFTNSGTEANEAALKAVRKHAHKTRRSNGVILAFHQSFHGRTSGALALTGQPKYHQDFTPLPGNILHVPFNDQAAVAEAFRSNDVVGVFVECIQGEGGVRPMEPGFAASLQKLCKAHGALLVVDEVQTGVGRTGRFFSFEHFNLKPDIITLSKALGGGLPLGACLLRDDLAALMGPGTHGCTFGGSPVACAAALAMLDVVARDDLVAKAATHGKALLSSLAAAGLPARGIGLLVGVPVPDAASAVATLREAGFLVGQAGPGVVRLAPPLIMDEETMLGIVAPLVAAVGVTVAATG